MISMAKLHTYIGLRCILGKEEGDLEGALARLGKLGQVFLYWDII